MGDDLRIDKWLWAMRIFKTRSLATEACKKGKVSIGDVDVKASRSIRVGEIIKVRIAPVTYTYKVLQLSHNRLPAKLVSAYCENMTTPEEQAKKNIIRKNAFIIRDRGAGRPTKKERRIIDKITGRQK